MPAIPANVLTIYSPEAQLRLWRAANGLGHAAGGLNKSIMAIILHHSKAPGDIKTRVVLLKAKPTVLRNTMKKHFVAVILGPKYTLDGFGTYA